MINRRPVPYLVYIFGDINYSTIFRILENNPNGSDIDIFFVIVAWAGSKSCIVENKSSRLSSLVGGGGQASFPEDIPQEVKTQMLTLCERFVQKDYTNDEQKSEVTRELKQMKRDRGEMDYMVYDEYINQSPQKTPVKNFSLKFFNEEIENHHPIAKVWSDKGDKSYRNFMNTCDAVLRCWLGVDEGSTLTSFPFLFGNSKNVSHVPNVNSYWMISKVSTRRRKSKLICAMVSNTAYHIKRRW